MLKWLGSLVDSNEKELKRLVPIVDRINEVEPEFERLSDAELRGKTEEFKNRLKAGETLDELLPETFAAVREAARRTIGQRPFDVQLMGGIVLHQGKIAEMKTGEGKTLVATLPLYLNSLTGGGCHLVTVNDYLARRDPYWMGPIYRALGVSVASIYPQQSPDDHTPSRLYDPDYDSGDARWQHFRPITRREAYQADIISAPDVEAEQRYQLFARLVPRLRAEVDYTIAEKERAVSLTDEGISSIERLLKREGVLKTPNLYDPSNYSLTRCLDSGLKAYALYKRDREYVVKDGEVIIVDEFTGRLMFGRRYAEGLHQAIEAKEHVRVQRETRTFATITVQNYFRMYDKLAGMTGTALTEAEEFYKIYKLDVVVVPTHKPMIRQDFSDQIYKNEEAKYRAVAREIEHLHQEGRPVLVGTVSIEKSEYLAELMKRRGIPHQVLNAKYHEKEANIIAQAGQPGAVTVATNMAGRGVDIILGGNPDGLGEAEWQEKHRKVVEPGGLHVIGTERHEARRIDNQLRGRTGRQGDPGSSRFYVSLEDDIMRRFGGDRIKGIMDWAGIDEDTPIENVLVNKAIADVQKRVEGYHFDVRKHLVEYDDVVNKHRELIYGERHKILSGADLKANILSMVREEIQDVVAAHTGDGRDYDWDVEGLIADVSTILPVPPTLSAEALSHMKPKEIEPRLIKEAEDLYEQREKELGAENIRVLERMVMLRTIDTLWVEHLTMMEHMREQAGWQTLRQMRAVDAYKNEGYKQFQLLLSTIQHDVAHTIYHVGIVKQEAPRPTAPVAAGGSKKQPLKVGGRKIGRNQPCPCGSGKKYKHCCGR